MQALRYHFISRREIKFMMILVNVFALFSAGLYYYRWISPLPFLMSSVIWILMMVAFWLWLPWTIYRRSKTFRDSFQVELDVHHFRIVTSQGGKVWAWREFRDMVETPKFFHLYFDERTFFLVPKDAFPDDAAMQEARGWIRNGLSR